MFRFVAKHETSGRSSGCVTRSVCVTKRFACQADDLLRVWHDVLAEGFACDLHCIERLMQLNAFQARSRHRQHLKDHEKRSFIAPNVLERTFEAECANQKWVADFTYIWTAQGWFYVAVVIDLFSRRLVGLSMSDTTTDTDLVWFSNQTVPVEISAHAS